MDWLRLRKIFFIVSLISILFGLYALINWGMNLGVDFTGGTIIEYKIGKEISTEEITKNLEKSEIEVTSIQTIDRGIYLFRLPPIKPERKEDIKKALEEYLGPGGEVEELRFELTGPSIGPELVRKTVYAILIAAGGILLWVAFQFKSMKFGVSAILAMFHDSFILVGSFAVLGHFYKVETDFLFVTALLTTLSFSVHDTIVVFDRIREIGKREGGKLYDVANQALTETMVRSLNNSFTIIFMLFALILMGGTTVKWFAVALLIGTVLGTYSSPFVAVPLLVYWEDFKIKR